MTAPFTDINKLFVSGASIGNIELMQEMLRRGADVNYNNGEALQVAAMNGRTDTIDFLAKHGVNMNGVEGRPLLAAVKNDYLAAVRSLLQHGASPNAGSAEVLYYTATWGSEAVMDMLLQHGGNVHASGDLALARAVNHCRPGMVALLLKYGADPFIQNGAMADIADNNDEPEMAAMIRQAQAEQRAFFDGYITGVADPVAALAAPYRDLNGYQTPEPAIVRAVMMGRIDVALDAVSAAGQSLTPALLLLSCNRHDHSVLRMVVDMGVTGALAKIFSPDLWKGRVDDMAACFETFWNGLFEHQQLKADMTPADIAGIVAEHRRQSMSGKKPPRFKPPGFAA